MEIKIKFPGGGSVEFKREPMGQERFNVICGLIGAFIIGSGVLRFFEMMVGA